MRSKILLFGLFVVLFSFGVSARTCSIETSCDANNTVLKLSSTTNAHGEIWSQSNYDYYLCCDFTTADSHSCSENNKVLKLSGETNAHAEIPTGTAYDTDVCFGDLSCESTISSCQEGQEILLRLSDDTNAHIAGPSETDYDILICCNSCQLTSSNWSVSETTDGNLVNLNVIGNEFCDGKAVSFEVFENELIGRDAVLVNPSNVIFSGSSATGSWVAEWIDDGFGQGNPEYVFTASLVDSPSIEIDDSGELIVLPGDGSVDCDNVTSCSNYLTSGSCVSDSCGVVDGSVESNNPLVDCGAGDTSCECAWVSNNCEPSYTNVAGDYVVGTCSYKESTSDDCEDGILSYSWTASWTWGHDGWLDWSDGPSESVGDYELDVGRYYYDPDSKFDGCVDGSTIVECPASIQVGFFGVWNFIIAIIVLVGVYFFIEIKKK